MGQKYSKERFGKITQEELFQYVVYQEDGSLIWKKRDPVNRFIKTFNILYAGTPVGNVAKTGYLETSLDQRRFLVHRLVFLYHKGYMPKFVDHIDGNPLNNKIENLREASHGENMQNTGIRKNNRSGASVKGVYRYGKHGMWRVQIMLEKVLHTRAGFENLEEAEAYAVILRGKLHKQFARDK